MADPFESFRAQDTFVETLEDTGTAAWAAKAVKSNNQ